MNKNPVKLQYRTLDEYIPVDMEKLRPKGSYKQLMNSRTYSIDRLIKKFGKIPEKLLISRSCPTCDSEKFENELEKDYMKIVKCDDCKLIYTNPIFDENNYRQIYQSDEYQELTKIYDNESHEYRVERFGSERVNILEKYVQKPMGSKKIKYLDVGCSTGFVVEAAQSRGWEAIGIDLNPETIQFGCTRGLNLLNKSLDELTFEENSFDIISMFDVLEHLPNPKTILEQAVKYTKSGGLIFLYLPNWDSASRILMGKNAHFIWPTHHLNYYNIDTISDLIERVGLQVEYFGTEGLDIMDYIWREKEINKDNVEAIENIADELQFFINAGGYGKNMRILARKS